jgi:hypothetical protein
MNKSDTFGVESKVGLYRVARHGKDTKGTPHWTCLINCDEICKNMMDRTKTDDTYNDLTAKRLALVMNKHAVARGSEFERLNIKKFVYNSYLDVLDTTWTETKTLKTYSCPFVDVFHSLGCYMACGRRLYRHGGNPDNSNLFHCLKPSVAVGQLDG